MAAARRSGYRFHEDEPGELLANGEPGIADLADKIVLVGYEADDLVFAQADFTQTVLDCRNRAKLPDAHRNARLNAIQGTKLAA